jgi:hypothetical protein
MRASLRQLGRALLAGFVGVVGIANPASAQSEPPAPNAPAPIVVGEAKDHRGCFIYLKPDGSRLLFQAKPITPRGDCPPDFALRGNVTRASVETYRLRVPAKNADCIITTQGLGRCEPGVIDDRPGAAPAQPPPVTAPPPLTTPPPLTERLPKAGGTL